MTEGTGALDPLGGEGPLLLMGGTFDPVHYGHLRPAEEVRQRVGAERVVLVPSGEPPHRAAPKTPAAHRLAMTRAAVAGFPTLGVLDWEVQAAGPSYTVRTLEWLRERLGRRPILIIIGSDAFTQLNHWHQWERMLDLTHIAAVRRPGTSLEALEPELARALEGRWTESPAVFHEQPAGAVMAFDVTRLDISATAIREMVGAGASPRFLLPHQVEEYLSAHGLYRQEP
ncbi:nicotinate-nucleotide adenylyltransferase [Thiohalorhabdus denitrificans]|uniref:Probable nicotinate-nucleotide adenylyltransferase n=1 Tax=Thiohalorhabdus denitrificans TaxID=381306 RepID=A0A1G5C8Y9_9GAMM|nr:nicotinate-nucleotide adenylyltransferase [Thiohalorhabdus denitrificans]SCX98862.1 nicotinate-nucleotide adenylyltransferase [Thiohalorhabdus denitrificans]